MRVDITKINAREYKVRHGEFEGSVTTNELGQFCGLMFLRVVKAIPAGKQVSLVVDEPMITETAEQKVRDILAHCSEQDRVEIVMNILRANMHKLVPLLRKELGG